MTKPTGIEEVVALENAIRTGLPRLTIGQLRSDAINIMGGKFPAVGTRLDALKDIVARIGLL